MTTTLTKADHKRPLFGSDADIRRFGVEPGRLPDDAEIRLLARVAVERLPITELRLVGEPEPRDPWEVVGWDDDPEGGRRVAITLADQLIDEGTILDHDPVRWQPYRALVGLWGDDYLVDWRARPTGRGSLWPFAPA